MNVVFAFAVMIAASLLTVPATSYVETALAPAQVYAKQCASCHGKDGRGKTLKGKLNHARDISDRSWQDDVSDERIFNSIMNGKGKKMPAYKKKLSEAEIDALVAYVRSLKK